MYIHYFYEESWKKSKENRTTTCDDFATPIAVLDSLDLHHTFSLNQRDTIRASVSFVPPFVFSFFFQLLLFLHLFFTFFLCRFSSFFSFFRLCFVAPIFYKTIITSFRPIREKFHLSFIYLYYVKKTTRTLLSFC